MFRRRLIKFGTVIGSYVRVLHLFFKVSKSFILRIYKRNSFQSLAAEIYIGEQAGLCLTWSHTYEVRFFRDVAQIVVLIPSSAGLAILIIRKKVNRNVQEEPQAQTAANLRHQEEEKK